MKTTTSIEKSKPSSAKPLQQQAEQAPFFQPQRQAEAEEEQVQAFFQPNQVQAKMEVGAPDDVFEREADAKADKVVSGSPDVQAKCAACEEEGKEKVSRQEGEEEEQVQARLIQRQGEEEEVQAKLLQRQGEEEEEAMQAKFLQRQGEEEEEAVQAKFLQRQGEEEEEAVQAKFLQRQGEEEEEAVQAKFLQRQGEEEEEAVQAKFLQRQGEEEEVQAKRLQKQEEEEAVQAKAKRTPIVTKEVETKINNAKGAGSPLPETVRAKMESGLGGDFSGVRVHTGSEGQELSASLNAQAFTVGNDIFFNKNKFSPNSKDGEHLLAHELVHTMQQGAAIKRKANVQREGDDADLAKQLQESVTERKEAIDPQPADQARKDAAQEAAAAQSEAAQDVPPPAPPETIAAPETPPAPTVATPQQKPADVVSSAIKPKKGETTGPAGEQLAKDSANACQDAANKSQTLANNQQAHDDPNTMVDQAEASVVAPTEEGQSRSNAEQVDTVQGADTPKADKAAIKSELDQAVSDAVPDSVESMNNFASEGKAQVIGNKVLEETSKQTGEVQGTYSEIENTPAAKPADPATPVPPQAPPPQTPNLNLGEGAVPELGKEQTNFDNFQQESDQIWEKEGVTPDLQGEIEKVDSGPLGEANQANKDLSDKVENQPAAAQEMAQTEQQKVKTEMQQEEDQARKDMDQKRKEELDGAAQEQAQTKTDMELKREEVTKWINDRFEQAKTLVEEKLNKLEKENMTTFDQGQKRLSIAFERNVNRRVDDWKDERYSGLFGGVKWLKDKLVGIDHFPEIKRIFSSEREAFIKGVDNLIADISRANEEVIQSCKDEVAKAQTDIKEYVDNLGPELQDIGQKALDETKAKLEALDKQVDEKKEALQKALCDKREAAIAAIDAKIEEMKSEMGGLVSKIGNLLLEAAKKFFMWALEKAGLNPSDLMKIIDKGATVLKAIFTDPIGFFKNLGKAVGGGINQFVTNIVKWLKQGLVSWLTGAMGDSGLELPEKFDLKGILFLGLQVAGLTWNVIRARLVKALGPSGEKMVGAAEKGVEIITRVVKEGPIALWNIIVEKAGEIKEMVMSGIRDWAITQIIKKATIKLVSMLNPAGAIVQAIILLYDTVMFFIENWQRILDFVNSVFDSISNIANGALGAASNFIEKALGMTVPIMISFLARFIGLGGIGKAVRNVIKKIQKPFQKILDKIIKFLVKQVRKVFNKITGKGGKKKGSKDKKKDNAKLKDTEVGEKLSFQAKGKGHKLYVKPKGKKAEIIVQSTPKSVGDKLTEWEGKTNSLGDKKADTEAKITNARTLYEKTKKEGNDSIKEMDEAKKQPTAKNAKDVEQAEKETVQAEKDLLKVLKKLFEIFGEEEDGAILKFVGKKFLKKDGSLTKYATDHKTEVEEAGYSIRAVDGKYHIQRGSGKGDKLMEVHFDAEGKLKLGPSKPAPKADIEKIKEYKDFLTKADLAAKITTPAYQKLEQAVNADGYRKQARTDIVSKYESSITQLNGFLARVKSIGNNSLRGSIFEKWAEKNGLKSTRKPVFIDDSLAKKRIADGIHPTESTKLVETKVHEAVAPGNTQIVQMIDYGKITRNGIPGKFKNDPDTEHRFTKIKYLFNTEAVRNKWLNKYLLKHIDAANLETSFAAAETGTTQQEQSELS